ncbi:MAG: type II methionyl aminopeptidase, partial [Candidatus Bathyarchaeia archaeon]
AFPCNVSINEVAAHYTSPPGDERVVPEGALVKIDIGVHIDGYIADTATTVCFNPNYEDMVHAAEKALENAISLMRPGMPIPRISSEIQATIERFGFKPISNLTGHEVDRYLIHSGKTIPNVAHLSTDKVRFGRVYAIEPFVTLKDAAGRVKDGMEKHIFRLVRYKSLKDADLQKTLKFIEENFKTLPFAERWLEKYCTQGVSYRRSLSSLLSLKCIMAYPVFIEASLKPVVQAEHTVYVDKDGPIVLT